MTVRRLLAGFAVAGILLGGATTASAAPAKKRAARPHAAAHKNLVDLNTASRARLSALPSVDNALADKIIAGRPYSSRNDLVSKNVLPADTFEKIKGRVVARKAVARKHAAQTRHHAARHAGTGHT